MSKILDVDALTPEPEKTVKLCGTEYPVSEITVGMMLELENLQAQITAAESSTDGLDQFKATYEACRRYLPTCPEEVLATLTPNQLMVVVQFVTSVSEEETAAGKE